ncbi:MAG: sulfatase-like hydrolase/transferase [Myxococcota bacterium]
MSEDQKPAEARDESEASAPRGVLGFVRAVLGNKRAMLALKLAFTVAMLSVVYDKVLKRDGAEDLLGRLGDIDAGWFVLAIAMQLTAITFATFRWRALLRGQGIRPGPGFLAGSIMIARFWGAFTPGGFTGFGGWRIFDVANHTGKTARATATIAVETLLGQVAFGLVVMGASLYGERFLGTGGVLLVNAFFLGIVSVALTLLARPRLFRLAIRLLPKAVQPKFHSLVDAVCAYEGKGWILAQAVALGVGVHAFNNLIYVCAARAVGAELGIGYVFFASSLQIFATLIPASINGIGLRETAAVALYTSPLVGLPMAVAVLIPTVGFAAEMLVSSVGGLVFLARRSGYAPTIEVDDADREEAFERELPEVPPEAWPQVPRAVAIGAGAGLLAGLLIGATEGLVIALGGDGRSGYGVLAYGALVYGVFCASAAATMLGVLAWVGRFMRRGAVPEADAYARTAALFVAMFGLVIGVFLIRRDVFDEKLVLKSPEGLGVLVACAVVAAALYAGLWIGLRALARKTPFLLRTWGSPAVCGVVLAVLAAGALLVGEPASAANGGPDRPAPEGAGNVLFVVVDTLRADHLPGYGYESGSTPNLEAFAADAIRFDQAFANASWTRPSFASILSGRLPGNHGVMAKTDALPDALVTMPEAFHANGWHTRGLATNPNLQVLYNFQQGFDRYDYLQADRVLWAEGASAKLLLLEVFRKVVNKAYALAKYVPPGLYYREAADVNRRVVEWLDEPSPAPFFYFVGYMDPHDPYYVHPYDGTGYARNANPRPEPEEADTLRRLYDGEITYWDERFGELIAELKARGLYEDLTIVITSDHGEEFCEHGGFWHGTTLYDEQVRVPLFVKLPENRRGGTVVRHWVQSIDLMPSLLRLEGIEVPAGVQGGDIFEGSDVVYAEESHEGNVLEAVRERRGTDEWKLITANEGNPRGLAPEELYRVDFDPGEQRNLAEDAEALAATQEQLAAQRRRAQEGALEAITRELGRDQLQQNCALGYEARESCCAQGLEAYCD